MLLGKEGDWYSQEYIGGLGVRVSAGRWDKKYTLLLRVKEEVLYWFGLQD